MVAPASIRFLKRLTMGAACLLLLAPLPAPAQRTKEYMEQAHRSREAP